MTTLKDNVQDFKHDTEVLVGEYLKLFSIKQSEKLALLLGVFASIFVLGILLFLVLIFASLALANFFNNFFAIETAGYLIVGGFYLLAIFIVIIRILVFKKPIFINLFVKIIATVFDIDLQQKTLKGVQNEVLHVNEKIDMEKDKIKGDTQMFRYVLMESFFREFFGLFKTKKKKDIDDTPGDSVIKDETINKS